jgi:hypothetical protein
MKVLNGTSAAVLLSLTSSLVLSDARGATLDITLQQIDRSSNNGSLGTIDLTQGGTALDWLKPIGNNLTFYQKAATSILTLAPQGATFNSGTYSDDSFTFTWSGGELPNASGSSFQGSNNTGAGMNVGYRVTYTAFDTQPFTLQWYSAANNVTNWRLTGLLGTATDFQQAGPNVGTTSGPGAVDDIFWTVTGVADFAGQVLTLDLVNTTSTNSAIAITGVTVVPEPSSALFLGLAAAGTGFLRRRSRKG